MVAESGETFSVLMVENDRHFMHLVKKSLQDCILFPSSVEQADTIRQAIDKVKKKPYHILLIEHEEDRKNDLELLQEIREAPHKLPFILMTPVRDQNMVKRAKELGAADLIIKNESRFRDLARKIAESYLKFHDTNGHDKDGDKILTQIRASSAHLFAPVRDSDSEEQMLAIRDGLTGLYNHSYLHERVAKEFSRGLRYAYPISCILIDIDHFKQINEREGYQAGDKLLKECASLLFKTCRVSDLIARFGGEEFAIHLPHEHYDGARRLAERLRRNFENHVFLEDSLKLRLTISVGISSFPDDSMSGRCELLNFATQALHRSKALGRNRITMYKDIMLAVDETLPKLKISESQISEFQHRLTEITDAARSAYIDASKALITALESKDSFTVGHAAHCAKYAFMVAESLGMPPDEAEMVEHAALLHDIGKICIPDQILLKPGKLTLEEYEVMKQHSYLGYRILRPIKFLQPESLLVLHHHEWFNGEGYPCRLKGNEIPLGSRIISVADTYDTIRSAGARYKNTAGVLEAVNELIAYAGIQFDPEIVRVFVLILQKLNELPADAAYNQKHLEEVLKAASPGFQPPPA